MFIVSIILIRDLVSAVALCEVALVPGSVVPRAVPRKDQGARVLVSCAATLAQII